MKKGSQIIRKRVYVSPDIEIVEIETEQSILAGGSGAGSVPNMPPEYW